MADPEKQPPRFHYMHHLLPRLNTNAKLRKDNAQRPTTLRKPLPPPPVYELPTPESSQFAPQLPPLQLESTPPNTRIPQTNRLQKPGHQALNDRLSTSILPPVSKDLLVDTASRPRGNSLLVPHVQAEYGSPRSVSTPLTVPRPDSYHSDGDQSSARLKKGFFGGRRSRNVSQDLGSIQSQAWINAASAKLDYNIAPLLIGQKVLELWNDAADTFVYLYPQSSGRGPQFRVPSSILWASQPLLNMLYDDSDQARSREKSFDGRQSLAIQDAMRNLAMRGVGTPPYTPDTSPSTFGAQDRHDRLGGSMPTYNDSQRQHHLYFPTGIHSAGSQGSPEELQELVEARNLFAFLTGQPLVAIHSSPTNFRIFLGIASSLRRLKFSSDDGSSFGSAVESALSFYLTDMPELADCRESREATMEALVLGEAMKSAELYNEAFAHATGKYDGIQAMRSPIFEMVSAPTRGRLEKASLDMKARQRSVNDRLTDFEFPSLFAGIAASASSNESKVVRFKAWRSSFLSMRKQVLAFYKDLHGQWPPKASSKKNNFVETGLNRLVLRGLYHDLCDLYDLLADRETMTTRVYNEDAGEPTNVSQVSAALRKLLDEYDRSSPPVQPPIPFDVPLIPSVKTVEAGYHMLSPKDKHKSLRRKLKDYETQLILVKSHNIDADCKTPFMEMYKAFEAKEARGKTSVELSEQRHGYWIFLYACLQALPLLITDAPGLRFTDGVEYFLCGVPLGTLPWMDDQSQVKMAWFGVQGGQQIVSLPSDVVNHGVEATYRRSHCWTVAEGWIGDMAAAYVPPPVDEGVLSPLAPPPGFAGELGSRGRRRRESVETGSARSRDSSMQSGAPSVRSQSCQSHRNSIALGLKPLPLAPDGGFASPGYFPPPSRGSSPSSRPGSSRTGHATPPQSQTKAPTFDDILGSMDQGKGSKKKGKK